MLLFLMHHSPNYILCGKRRHSVFNWQTELDLIQFPFKPADEDVISMSDTEIVEEDDEEAWLEALEAGELNEHGELKKEKDVNLLTARQVIKIFNIALMVIAKNNNTKCAYVRKTEVTDDFSHLQTNQAHWHFRHSIA